MNVQVDSMVFLVLPGELARYASGTATELRRLSSGARTLLVEFEGPASITEETVRLYYKFDGSFWRWDCRVVEQTPTDAGCDVTFESRNSPRREEHRQGDRLSVYSDGITASVNGAPESLVVNLSNGGFAVVSREPHVVGETVQAQLKWNGHTWVGTMQVRHVAEAVNGSWICGLACEPGREGRDLRDGLQRVSATVSFQQIVLAEATPPRKQG